jgi:ABC-type polysaccharide/polyol phosphate export permease
MGGVLPWTFFSSTLDMSSSILINSRSLLHSFSISPFVVVAIMVIENFVTFLLSFLLLTIVLYSFYSFPLQNLYFFPIAALMLFLFTTFTATAIAILNVFYRDIKFIVTFSLSILFFLTPILYPEDRFPSGQRWIVDYNPIYKVILPLRSCIYEFHNPISKIQIFEAILSILIAFAFATFNWSRFKNEIIKKL